MHRLVNTARDSRGPESASQESPRPLRASAFADILTGMRSEAYAALDSIRKEFRALVDAWSAENPYLIEAQERVREKQGYDDYRVETAVVYNRALDEIEPDSEIKVILVADNPGKKEQLAANNRYLVGQSGKLAEGWFRRELGIDFRREVLILNKTPVHTPKTAELALLSRSAGLHRDRLEALLAGTQSAMADLAWRLYLRARRGTDRVGAAAMLARCSGYRAWGAAEGRPLRGIPRRARPTPRGGRAGPRSGVWAFNHFSMNQFAIELKRKARPGAPMLEELAPSRAGE